MNTEMVKCLFADFMWVVDRRPEEKTEDSEKDSNGKRKGRGSRREPERVLSVRNVNYSFLFHLALFCLNKDLR